jgi:hypothetical protein
MTQTPSSEGHSSPAGQEVPRILRNPNVYYCIRISSPFVPTTWRSILILSFYLRLGLPSGVFPYGFPTKTLYAPHLSPKSTAYTAPIVLDLITRIIIGRNVCTLLAWYTYGPGQTSRAPGVWGFQNFQDNQHMKLARLSAVCAGRLYPPPPEMVEPRPIVRSYGLSKWKIQWPHQESNPRPSGL